MNKSKKIIITIMCFLSFIFLAVTVFATTAEDYLIKVGNGSYSITVKKDTTIDEISSVLGTPKLQTQSAFGGYAYTFYTDNNYSNYLYVETLKDGRIVSYGSVDKTYQTKTLSYGEENPYIYGGGPYLQGMFCTDTKDDYKIKGGIYYNKTLVKKAEYEEKFLSNSTLYSKELSKQAIVMYNALSTNLGKKTNFVFDEKLYDINQAYKKKDSDILEFLRNASYKVGTDYRSISLRENIDITNAYYVLNPMSYAYKAIYNLSDNYENFTYAVFDYDYTTKIMECFTISENMKNSFYYNNASSLAINKEEVQLAQSVLYAMSLLDDNMTDKEKATILAQYTQEGNVYGFGNRDQNYKGILIDHQAVCGGYSDTFKFLLNNAGIICEKISSRTGNHGWNVCFIDGKWTYMDTTKGMFGTGSGAISTNTRTREFSSKSDISDSMHYFADGVLSNDIFDTFPEGETLESYGYDSHVYYDNQYKYYIDRFWETVNGNVETITGLYREDRTTKEKKILANPLVDYDGADSNLVKNNDKLYFVGQDKKSIYSIKTDGTAKTLEYKTTNSDEEIGGVFVLDGYMYYTTYYPNEPENTRLTEKANKFLKLSNASSEYEIYTLNNDKQQYRLIYVKNTDSVSIVKCIGIGNNLPNGQIYIPSTIDGLPVIGIASNAFYDLELTGELVIPRNSRIYRRISILRL